MSTTVEESWALLKREFDWKFVHETMKKLRWKWVLENWEMKTPTMEEIQAHGRKLHERAWEPVAVGGVEMMMCSGGGFTAIAFRRAHGEIGVRLLFCLHEASS